MYSIFYYDLIMGLSQSQRICFIEPVCFLHFSYLVIISNENIQR